MPLNPIGDISDSFFKNLFDAIGGVFKRNKISVEQALRDSITMKHIARDICKNGNNFIDCFFIMMIHNGGSKVLPHGFIYRSIIGGYHEDWSMPHFVAENYKYLELDYEYELLMGQLFKNKEVALDSEAMEESKLKTKLKFEKLKFVRYHFLKSNKRGLWYAMTGTTQPGQRLDTVEDMHETNIALNKIKNIIKKYK